MKLRTLVISVVLLAAFSVGAYLRNRPDVAPLADPRVGAPLLDRETASAAAGLIVSDQGKSVELARGPDGVWRVPGYFGMPADFEKISRLVQDLNEAKVDRLVTANPDRIGRLEFKDSFIALKDAAGRESWRITLGKAADSGNGRFIRFGSEPKAFFSGLHTWLDTDAKGWASAQLVTVKPDDIAKIEIPFDSGRTVVASRAKKEDPWRATAPPPGQKLVADKVASVVTALTALRFSDTVDPKDPGAALAAAHLRTLKLTTFDGRTITVALGRTPEVKKLKPPVADAKDVASLAQGADGKPEVKAIAPEFDTTPAGPVFAFVANSDAMDAINDLMRKRAFQVDEYTLTSLPQKSEEFFEADKAK
jgi:Domain of unknown function (DUF4340)